MQKNLFVVILRYLVPLETIDTHRDEHIKFIESYYTKGIFVVSGRQVPRSGGVIIAKAESRLALEQILKEDPFTVHHLVEHQIYEFIPSQEIKG
jgi:uncharacterized protein YciI